MNNCIECNKEFETYINTAVCYSCDGEGSAEIQAEFGDGWEYKGCNKCGGKGEYSNYETKFCSEDCMLDCLNFLK